MADEKVDVEELERLMAEASRGPWLVKLTGYGMGRLYPSFCLGDTDPVEWKEADYVLISALRNAAPALLAELRELRSAQSAVADMALQIRELSAGKAEAEGMAKTAQEENEAHVTGLRWFADFLECEPTYNACLGAIRSAVKTARAEALEEAAKVCEVSVAFNRKQGFDVAADALGDATERIRSLATDGGTGDGK